MQIPEPQRLGRDARQRGTTTDAAPTRHLTIRRLLWLCQVLVTIAVCLLLAVGYYSQQQAAVVRGALVRDALQLEATTRVKVAYNRYAEQIVELVALGLEQRPDFERADRVLHARIMHLHSLLAESGKEAAPAATDTSGTDTQQRLADVGALLNELDPVVDELQRAVEAGRIEAATSLLRDRIEDDLDRRLVAALESLIERARQQVAAANWAADALTRRTLLLFFLLAAVSIALSVLAGAVYYWRVSRPVARLMRGVEALEQRDLDWRIGDLGSDEFGALGHRFDAMAAELQRRDAILDQQVRERTAELAIANQRLRERYEQRMHFLAEISHELRTPLTVLRGEAEITLRDGANGDAECRRTLARVIEKARAMGRLLDDLLLLARSDAGQLEIERQPVDICDVVAAAVGDGDVLAEGADVEVMLHLPERWPTCIGDARRLQQAVTIGLDNAVKYSPEGGRVDVMVEVGENALTIGIADQGIGITPVERRRAFERFYRGGPSRARPSQGLGLGLPIAKWIVEAHGGAIDLAAGPEGGAVLTMRLPLAATEGDTA